LPDTWDATSRDTIENRENEIVNNSEQYISVVETGIGGVKMCIAGEVDAGTKEIKQQTATPRLDYLTFP